jgi:catechol 2,3-dioxygenase-like lactoylglutathione lyase family enzyme
MLSGAHVILSSTDAKADREFLRDVLGLSGVDAGEGWLIFGLPPAEVAVHPAGENDAHELYLMCDDIEAFIAEMARRGVACPDGQNRGWGVVTTLPLPGGGRLGVYEPRHARPEPMAARRAVRKARRPASRKPSRKRSARARGGTRTRT